MPLPGDKLTGGAFKHCQGAEAVMFDFKDPFWIIKRLGCCVENESQPCSPPLAQTLERNGLSRTLCRGGRRTMPLA
jgi:hypothetical protein